MNQIKLLAIDVDGTITISSDSYRLYTPAIDIITKLSREGYYVVLVSGNSVPMMVGLARYLGASDIVVAENGGSIVLGDEINWLCEEHEQRLLEELEEYISRLFGGYLKKSWQNNFMRCGKAFKKIRDDIDTETLITDLINRLSDDGYKDLYIASSKVAIHVNLLKYTKGYALERILQRLNLNWRNVLAVGDSDIDVDMIKRAEIGCAVANASTRLREVANCFSGYEAGRGFVDIIERYILRGVGRGVLS